MAASGALAFEFQSPFEDYPLKDRDDTFRETLKMVEFQSPFEDYVLPDDAECQARIEALIEFQSPSEDCHL